MIDPLADLNFLGSTPVVGSNAENRGNAPDFGRGQGEIFLDDLLCVGNESTLLHCTKAQNCNADEAAGVICEGNGERNKLTAAVAKLLIVFLMLFQL